jgi:hypothetical protein
MLGSVHGLRYILYTRRFESWFCSRLQVIGCHKTDFFCIISDNTGSVFSILACDSEGPAFDPDRCH